MPDTPVDVDACLTVAPDDHRQALVRLRALCGKIIVGFEEGIVYGMPGFSRHGDVEVAFASRKSSITI